MADRPARFLAPLVSFLLSTAVFLFTLAPSIYPGDSPEFSAAAHTLGIPHPPGYPQYVLLGKIWTLFPFGNVAFRLNLLSAAGAGLAACAFAWLLVHLGGNPLTAVAGALLMAFSRDIFAQAGSAEAYPLNLFGVLLLLCLAAATSRRGADATDEAPDDRRNAALFRSAAFVFGYSLGIHYFVVFVLPGILFLFYRRMGRTAFLRAAGGAVPAGLGGWALFLLLPLRAAAHPPLNWGETSDPVNFLVHVGWLQYSGRPSLGFSWERLATRAADLVRLFAAQWPLPLHLLLPPGLVFLWRRFRSDILPAVLLVLVVPSAATLVLLNDPGSEVFFGISSNKFLTGYAAYALLLAAGGQQVGEWIASLAAVASVPRRAKRAAAAAGAALCALAAFTLRANLASADRSRSIQLPAYVQNLLDPLPADSGLAAEYDVPTFPLLYSRYVEEYRPDVALYGRTGILFGAEYNAAYAAKGAAAQERARRRIDSDLIRRHRGRMFFCNQADPYAPGGDAPALPYGLAYLPAGGWLPPAFPDPWSARFVTSPFRGDLRLLDHRNRELVSDMYRMAAEAAIRERRPDDASRLLEEALDAAPGYYWIHYYAGVLRYRVWGDAAEAERQLERAAAIVPSEAPLAQIGNIRFGEGDVRSALDDFLLALSFNPEHVASLRNAAECQVALGDFAAAELLLDRALRADPSMKDAWVRLGQVQGNLGKFREARASFTKALDIAPRDGEIYFLRGAASLGAGMAPESESDFRSALSLSPERRDIGEMISRLRNRGASR